MLIIFHVFMGFLGARSLIPLKTWSLLAIIWVWPPHSNSYHQDYYIFSRGSQPKPAFATGILGGGHMQAI